jgi:uracil-DNA glycosylase
LSRAASEIDRCRWWLDHDRSIVRPELIVALGATAAHNFFPAPRYLSSFGQCREWNPRMYPALRNVWDAGRFS